MVEVDFNARRNRLWRAGRLTFLEGIFKVALEASAVGAGTTGPLLASV